MDRKYQYQVLRRIEPPGAKETHANVKKVETYADARQELLNLASREKLDTLDPHNFTILNLGTWEECDLPTVPKPKEISA
jgi:hypothetical protein